MMFLRVKPLRARRVFYILCVLISLMPAIVFLLSKALTMKSNSVGIKRRNSSKFDMNDLSLNFVAASTTGSYEFTVNNYPYSNSLLRWLRIIPASIPTPTSSNVPMSANLSAAQLAYPLGWCNADSYLAYWDIVRNYYSYQVLGQAKE